MMTESTGGGPAASSSTQEQRCLLEASAVATVHAPDGGAAVSVPASAVVDGTENAADNDTERTT